MKHFIERFAEAAQNNWHKPAVCDYRGETFYYADVATHIAKLHIVFEKLGVKVGDKIAISANNTARWGITYLAIIAYRAVDQLTDGIADVVSRGQRTDALHGESTGGSDLGCSGAENIFGHIYRKICHRAKAANGHSLPGSRL